MHAAQSGANRSGDPIAFGMRRRDHERRLGLPAALLFGDGGKVGGGQLWEPCNKTDIRRWVMALDYVNPLHWDQRFARETKSLPMPIVLNSTRV